MLSASVTVNVALLINPLGVNVSCVELTLVTVPEVNPPEIDTVDVVKFVPFRVINPFAACVILVIVGKVAE